MNFIALLKKNKKYIKKLLELLIYSFVIWFIYNRLSGNFDQLREVEVVSWYYLVLAVLLHSLHTLWNGLNWHFMISASGENVSRTGQISVYLRSYIMRYIPGNVVGILSRGIYNKEYNIPLLKSLWGWFLENLIYLSVGFLIGSIILIQKGNALFSLLEFGNEPDILLKIAIVLVYLVTIFVLFDDRVLKRLFNKFVKPRLPVEAQDEVQIIDMSVKNRLLLVIRYLLSWVIYSLSYIALLAALDINIGMLEAVSINAISWSLGYMSLVTPSGAGVREGVMAFLLESASGVTSGLAIIVTVVARFVFIAGELSGVLFFYLYKLLAINNGK
jgi:hypothetical protein